MKLAIDIGNSRTKYGIFENDELVFTDTVDYLEWIKITDLFKEFPGIQSAILSSVSQTTPEAIDYLKSNVAFVELDHATELPFQNVYKSPETLGRDRIAVAAGSMVLAASSNRLVIDAGTCITFDLLNADDEYLGGGISPGINMRFEAMHTFTGKLPLVKLNLSVQNKLIGDTTESSMVSGVQNGIISEVDGIIERYKSNFPDLKVIVTGGDYKYFDKYLKNNIFAAPNLVLIGLKKILDFNEDS